MNSYCVSIQRWLREQRLEKTVLSKCLEMTYSCSELFIVLILMLFSIYEPDCTGFHSPPRSPVCDLSLCIVNIQSKCYISPLESCSLSLSVS